MLVLIGFLSALDLFYYFIGSDLRPIGEIFGGLLLKQIWKKNLENLKNIIEKWENFLQSF